MARWFTGLGVRHPNQIGSMSLTITHTRLNACLTSQLPVPGDVPAGSGGEPLPLGYAGAVSESRRSERHRSTNSWLRLPCPAALEHVRRRSPHARPHFAAPVGRDGSLVARRSLRQAEFRAGRSCARQALLRAEKRRRGRFSNASNLPLPVVGQFPSRAPSWPAGYVGSITHSHNWVWAAVASNRQFRALGIDTEPVADPKVAHQVADCVGDSCEWQALGRDLNWPYEALFSLLFSAKEAFYKLYQPLLGLSFDFLDVGLTGNAQADVSEGEIVGQLQLQFSPRFTTERWSAVACNIGETSPPQPLEIQFQWSGPDLFTLAWLTAETAPRTTHEQPAVEEDGR
jgi:4'-phosphopantetheinyl transferase EntD